jgi:hypothetical protein
LQKIIGSIFSQIQFHQRGEVICCPLQQNDIDVIFSNQTAPVGNDIPTMLPKALCGAQKPAL